MLLQNGRGLLFCMLTTCLLFVLHGTSVSGQSTTWSATFDPKKTTIHMNEQATINLTISGLNANRLKNESAAITVMSDSSIAGVSFPIPLDEIVEGTWKGTFKINAIFLGSANVYVVIKYDKGEERSQESLPVIIIREERIIDTVFTVSVAALVSILYINFGAAIDLTKVKAIIVRPIGPAIACFCQFVFLPVASYLLGILIFPDSVEMQLGMFFTGVSPAGGASNVWCVLLGGNLDLSIAMTTISTFSAFAMMPLWIFTLGRAIFDRGDLIVPYQRIATFAFGLLIPLGIGLLIQRYLPRLARILVRILKSFSALLIIFIIFFAIITNLYLFQLFSWKIIVAGSSLPWLGYFAGWSLAKILKQPTVDRLAIAIEAGIQNTGIAIFILRFALGQPQADLTTIIPVSVAIMTPLPLLGFWICLLCRKKMTSARERENLMAGKDGNSPTIVTGDREGDAANLSRNN